MSKATIVLLNLEDIPTFNVVQIPDEQGLFDKNSNSKEKKVNTRKLSQKPSKT